MSRPPPFSSWREAMSWLDRFFRDPETAPYARTRGPARAHSPHTQELIYGVLRNARALEWFLLPEVRKAPRGLLRSGLLLALWELLRSPTTPPALVVDHAVRQLRSVCSAREAQFANAVLRRCAAALPERQAALSSLGPEQWGLVFSHPDALVASWRRSFGDRPTKALLEWNQSPPPLFWRQRPGHPLPEGLSPTATPDFFAVPPGGAEALRPFLEAGHGYLQDLSTRGPLELLPDQTPASVLDLCAAPGGKTLLLADHFAATNSFPNTLCLDKEGPRLNRLKDNLRRAGRADQCPVRAADLHQPLVPWLQKEGLPTAWEWVLLDLPCSNTGVFRRRPEARWRWSPAGFQQLLDLQSRFLREAATAVAPGGLLIYSTCSIEPAENEDRIDCFLQNEGKNLFVLERSKRTTPWDDHLDGAACFALRRS